MGISNFKRCLQFIKNLVRTFIISRRYTRVGAVLYNTRAYKMFGFNRYSSKNQVLRAVSLIQYPKGGTKTGRALNYAYRYLFRRSRRRKVSILGLGITVRAHWSLLVRHRKFPFRKRSLPFLRQFFNCFFIIKKKNFPTQN